MLPLFAPEVWTGFRLAPSDIILANLSFAEQPLSVRTPLGLWPFGVALVWFGLAYWRRDARAWEAVLVLVGGAAALARVGNQWVFGLLMLAPLARQVGMVRWRPWSFGVIAAMGLAATATTLVVTRPPELPPSAIQAALTSPVTGTVFADWRWASQLQSKAADSRTVLARGGLVSEPADYWLDYLRVTQGHERWAALLRDWRVGVVVMDAAGQDRKVAELIKNSAEWRVLVDAHGTLVAERAPG
ncbi:MAG TPA: hypothetical protein VGQ62_10610 [Chloroflexota bacterium]|nr:hypothetical protein [Chloroflexota bacterium]